MAGSNEDLTDIGFDFEGLGFAAAVVSPEEDFVLSWGQRFERDHQICSGPADILSFDRNDLAAFAAEPNVSASLFQRGFGNIARQCSDDAARCFLDLNGDLPPAIAMHADKRGFRGREYLFGFCEGRIFRVVGIDDFKAAAAGAAEKDQAETSRGNRAKRI